MEEVKKILGTVQELRVGSKVVDLYPLRLNDWPKFAENFEAIRPKRLQDIFKYIDAPDALQEIFKLVTRKDPLPELYFDMTQKEYADFRMKVIGQNDLDLDKEVKTKERKNEKSPSQ